MDNSQREEARFTFIFVFWQTTGQRSVVSQLI